MASVKQPQPLNPANTGRIVVTFCHPLPTPNTPPSVTGSSEPVHPPLPGGVNPKISIYAPQTYYDWEDPNTLAVQKAVVQVKLAYPDNTPAVGRPIIFAISGQFVGGYDTYVKRTDINGVATLQYAPFGVPPDSTATASYTIFAEFWGY